METSSEEYKEHLENKYLPGRDIYLKKVFFPKLYKEFKEGEIVDLGCGVGEFLSYCKDKNRAAIGVDSNEFLIDICIKKGFKAIVDDVTNPVNLKDKIKNAICDNVLEHLTINESDSFFKNLKNIMETEGTLIVIVPDKRGYKNDPTHKTFVEPKLINTFCKKYNIKLKKYFYHPINIGFVGNFFYLNMQVFVLKF